MPLELHNSGKEPPSQKLKLAIVGKEKHGKSWLASTGRKPVLIHDFDGRAESLAGKDGVFVLSYIDPVWPKMPEAAQKFLDILGKLEESLDLSKLGFDVPQGTIVKTNVIDSIHTCGKAFSAYALYGQKDLRREITFGGFKVFLGNGWDSWNAEMTSVENSFLRMVALPTDAIITLHETAEEADDSTSEKPRYTGKVGVYPVRYQRLLKYVNDLWRVKLTQVMSNGNKMAFLPRVYALPTYEFDAASTLLVDAVEEPNIEAMLLKNQNKLRGSESQKKQLTQEVKVKL